MPAQTEPLETLETAIVADEQGMSWGKQRIRRRLIVHGLQLTVIVLLLLGWGYSPTSIIPIPAVSRPGPVGSELWKLISSGQIFGALGTTALAIVEAMVIAAPVGILLGVIASNKIAGWLLEPIVTVGYAIPKVGLITIYIVVLGVNTKSHVVLVLSTVVFIYYYAMRQALSEVDTATVSALRLMGASSMKVARSVILPASVPPLLGATRVALPLAFATEIYAELRVPTSGLGVLLGNFTYNLSAAQTVAVAIFVAAIAYIVDIFLGAGLRYYSKITGMRES